MLKVYDEFGLSTLDFEREDFLKPDYFTQIGYQPLWIDILNNIDGLKLNY